MGIIWVDVVKFWKCLVSVWKSGPVQSLAYFWKDRDQDQSINILEPPKTGLDRFSSLFQSEDQSGPVLVLTSLYWFKTGLLDIFALVESFE